MNKNTWLNYLGFNLGVPVSKTGRRTLKPMLILLDLKPIISMNHRINVPQKRAAKAELIFLVKEPDFLTEMILPNMIKFT